MNLEIPSPGPDTPPESLESLEQEITRLAGFINAATCRFLMLVAEFDRREGWQGAGMVSCAHWLNWRCGIGLVAAREKVRVAHALSDLDRIRASFEAGEISYSKVRAMTRIATPENEELLLQVARHGTAHHVETLVRKYRRARELQMLDQANAQYERRGLHYRHEEDDSVTIRITLPPEQGALVLQAVKAMAERLWRDANDSAESSDEAPTPGQRQADALVAMAEQSLARGDEGEPKGSAADRYLVTVHVSEETLSEKPDHRCELDDGPVLAVETVRRLACDAGIVRMREDEEGNALDVGRKTRAIPPAMRRALQNRDGGCRFAGCTRTQHTDGHHIRHWADGGETCLDNLVLLCRHHHRLVHEGGFDAHVDAGGLLRFTTPAGALLPVSSPPIKLRATFEEQLETIQRNRPQPIDHRTANCRWTGETMDYDHAGWLLGNRESDGDRLPYL